MKNLLIFLFLVISINSNATHYYISTSGSNSNNGSIGSPWASLSYACSRSVSGDVIHLTAGTYTESTQCVLPAGVSVEGAGTAKTTIIANVGATSLLYLASASQGTNGNQHISGIYFNGNSQNTHCAVQVYARSNVSIYNCTFINFDKYGLIFHGYVNGQSPSTSVTYATGNSVYDCVITNCAYYSEGVGGGANIFMTTQTGFECHNNTITQSRTVYTNGCGIKTGGWTKGLQIHDNRLTGQIQSDKEVRGSWDFAIETWGDVGSITEGVHIYNNTILNWEIDIAGRVTQKGSYAYGVSIHDNFIGCESLPSVNKIGIWLEANTSLEDILIYNNHIKNVNKAIGLYATNQVPHPTYYRNISIYYNIFENIGHDVNGLDSSYGFIWTNGTGTTVTVSNIKIVNNVFSASTRANSTQWAAIVLVPKSTVTAKNFEIRNNIIIGFENSPITTNSTWQTGVGTISDLFIQNNIMYGNGNSNAPNLGVSIPYYVNSNNLTSSPLFASGVDFHLQAGSPAIGKGLSLSGITTDYSGNAVKSPPSIGAFESGPSTAVSGAIPAIQSSVVEDATPSLLSLIYDLTLSSSIVPPPSSFSLIVNGVSRTISSVSISGNKAQLSMATSIKYGDVITISYTKPTTNPIQSTTGGIAANISTRTATNNLASLAKDALPVAITMTVSPNHIHKTINVALNYSNALTTSQITAITHQILRITDTSGKLCVEKLLVAGTTSIKLPLNLYAGIYNVLILSNGVTAASQKIMVY